MTDKIFFSSYSYIQIYNHTCLKRLSQRSRNSVMQLWVGLSSFIVEYLWISLLFMFIKKNMWKIMCVHNLHGRSNWHWTTYNYYAEYSSVRVLSVIVCMVRPIYIWKKKSSKCTVSRTVVGSVCVCVWKFMLIFCYTHTCIEYRYTHGCCVQNTYFEHDIIRQKIVLVQAFASKFLQLLNVHLDVVAANWFFAETTLNQFVFHDD